MCDACSLARRVHVPPGCFVHVGPPPSEVKAVKYKPHPIGSNVENLDMYSARFMRIHKRDLAVISRTLACCVWGFDASSRNVNLVDLLLNSSAEEGAMFAMSCSCV